MTSVIWRLPFHINQIYNDTALKYELSCLQSFNMKYLHISVVTLFVMCGNGWMEEVAFVIIMEKRPYCSIVRILCCARSC